MSGSVRLAGLWTVNCVSGQTQWCIPATKGKIGFYAPKLPLRYTPEKISVKEKDIVVARPYHIIQNLSANCSHPDDDDDESA
jgi:hypothetical protein